MLVQYSLYKYVQVAQSNYNNLLIVYKSKHISAPKDNCKNYAMHNLSQKLFGHLCKKLQALKLLFLLPLLMLFFHALHYCMPKQDPTLNVEQRGCLKTV